MAGETGRRTFMSAAVAGAVVALEPSVVFGTRSNSKIELGLIGCGGRGNWIASLFNETGKYRFVACADYFEDRAGATAGKLQIESGHCHSGLSGYRRLLDGKLDAVVIESPPYFHPEHAAAAVDAGKHVFLAKPIAVDVPGCKSIGASGSKATSRKLVFLVDFQTRANEYYREAVRRVRTGDFRGPRTSAPVRLPRDLCSQPLQNKPPRFAKVKVTARKRPSLRRRRKVVVRSTRRHSIQLHASMLSCL